MSDHTLALSGVTQHPAPRGSEEPLHHHRERQPAMKLLIHDLLRVLALLDRFDIATLRTLASRAKEVLATSPKELEGWNPTVDIARLIEVIQDILVHYGPREVLPQGLAHASRRHTRGRSLHRVAWENVDRLLSPEGCPSAALPFLRLAEQKAAERLLVEDAARALRISRRTLHRISKDHFRFPPGVILALAQTAVVARRLVDSDETLGAIASACGFNSAQSMSRRFRRFTGTSPETFRAIWRGRSPVSKRSTNVAQSAGCHE